MTSPLRRLDGRQAGAGGRGAVRNCPHCDQPVTFVALLATPEAARPTIASRVREITSLAADSVSAAGNNFA